MIYRTSEGFHSSKCLREFVKNFCASKKQGPFPKILFNVW